MVLFRHTPKEGSIGPQTAYRMPVSPAEAFVAGRSAER